MYLLGHRYRLLPGRHPSAARDLEVASSRAEAHGEARGSLADRVVGRLSLPEASHFLQGCLFLRSIACCILPVVPLQTSPSVPPFLLQVQSE